MSEYVISLGCLRQIVRKCSVMRRARNIVRYFIVCLIIVATLQLGFLLFTNFSPSRSKSCTNQLCKQLGNEQELGRTSSSRHPGTESTQAQHKTTLITNRTCGKYYFLLILVSSAPANFQRRYYIRKTWAFESTFKPRWTTVFLVAQARLQKESNLLSKEDEIYGDLVRADYYDHYWNNTLKIKMGFEWATRYCKFSFLLKVDDDVFVNSVGVLSFLSKPATPDEKLFVGNHYKSPYVQRGGKWKVTKEEYSEDYYPDFCPGFGFILSHDVVVTFVEAFVILPYYRMDDVYVGMLAKETGIKIMHNVGFEFENPDTLCIPNEATLVRHGYGTGGECLIEIFNRVSEIHYPGRSNGTLLTV